MLLTYVHHALKAVFLVLPVVALVVAVVARFAGSRRAMHAYFVTAFAGIVIGTLLTLLFANLMQGRPIPMQAVLASYFAIGLLLFMKCFDWVLTASLAKALGVPGRRRSPEASQSGVELKQPSRLRYALLHLFRIGILFSLGLPYVMATVMTYRAKVGPSSDPQKSLGFNFERVEFTSTDNVRLVGWWIPAIQQSRPSQAAAESSLKTTRPWGTETVLICHGLAASKDNQLAMARSFPENGYNVLIFDFRAHGESGGQLTTFGDFERRDVLGAVRYLRTEHAADSERILGVGASMGAAALLAAAADQTAEGQAIDAVAVYGTYDNLGTLADSVAGLYFKPPLSWLIKHFAVPMASAHTGTNLRAFTPARYADDLWPRPFLVIHGVDDEIIPFEHGRALFDAATLPKRALWLPRMSHNSIVNDENANRTVLRFFRTADDVPVI